MRDGGMWRWELSGEGIDGRRGWMLTMEGKRNGMENERRLTGDRVSGEEEKGFGLVRACQALLRWRIGESNSGFH